MLDIWVVVSIFARFSLYFSVLTAAGTALVVPIFRLRYIKHVAVKVILVALFASFTLFGLDAIALTGDLSGLVDLEILSLLSETSSGKAFYIRMAGLNLLLIGLLINGLGKWISVFGAFISIYSFTNVGHMHDHNSQIISLALFVHLLTVALWIGILFPLRNLALHDKDIKTTARVAHRFGQFAVTFVPVLLMAGAYMVWVSFESLEDLVSSGYGQTLIIKVLVVLSLLVLAAFNKLRFVPQLRQGDFLAARSLVKTINAEGAVIAVVLIITAVLTTASEL